MTHDEKFTAKILWFCDNSQRHFWPFLVHFQNRVEYLHKSYVDFLLMNL